VIAIKVDSRKVEGHAVAAAPMFEIYVHSRIEGIHLRGGKVARGGIRWSDRHDDFRTEILGLMKTQMVKNSIIVPVGAKGGFVLKGQVPPRPALDAYLIDRYREYVSGLLDVTDNRVDGQVAHPPAVVRHDGDDAYLVVAADKGTAHLSDTANSVSAQYGFWLGDAFASGGSAGYDHKKMGITARGAWECVEHHFRNLGRDIGRETFTVRGHRRHVRRRVRQRRTALAQHEAGRGVQPRAHLHRPGSGSREELRRARAAVPAAALRLARLRRVADQQGRRRVRPLGQGDRSLARDQAAARARGRERVGRGRDQAHPDGAGRPAL
jgi:hypothetical protein